MNKFWIVAQDVGNNKVYVDDPPRHNSKEKAYLEAENLCRKKDARFVVFAVEVVGYVEPAERPVVWSQWVDVEISLPVEPVDPDCSLELRDEFVAELKTELGKKPRKTRADKGKKRGYISPSTELEPKTTPWAPEDGHWAKVDEARDREKSIGLTAEEAGDEQIAAIGAVGLNFMSIEELDRYIAHLREKYGKAESGS